jgi:hypothetical protein
MITNKSSANVPKQMDNDFRQSGGMVGEGSDCAGGIMEKFVVKTKLMPPPFESVGSSPILIPQSHSKAGL